MMALTMPLIEGDAAAPVERPAITLTVFRKEGGPLTKRLSADEDGALVSDGSACRMSHGEARAISIANMEEFADLIGGLGEAEAIALGTVKPDALDSHGRARIVRHAELTEPVAVATISRTLEFIQFPNGRPGLMLLDFDTKGMSADLLARIQSEGFDAVLGEVAPDILAASRVWRPSTSSGVRNTATGISFDKAGGHLYLAVADAADIPRATKALHQRCWLAGFGHILVGRAGQLLERSIIDIAVGSPERLVFEGPPQVVEPLVQEPRSSAVTRGKLLNSRTAIPDLSPSETALFDDMIATAREEADVRAAPIHKAVDAAEVGKLRAIGVSESEARERVAARHQGKLYPHIELHFDNASVATVGEVLANPSTFDHETLADPMEPDTGRCRAKLFVNASGKVIINTFARGGASLKLIADRAVIERVVGEREPAAVIADVKRLMASAVLSPTDFDAVVAATALRSGAGKRSVRKELESAQKIAREASSTARLIGRPSEGDRLTLEAPATAGELGPTLRAVDARLCAIDIPEPPFRLSDGRLGLIRETSPGGLHLLLTEAEDAAQRRGDTLSLIPVPPQAALLPAEYLDAALEIEKFVRIERQTKEGDTYAVRIPEPHGKAYLTWMDSKLPRVSALVTLPLVLPNQKLLTGRGLDARRQVIFRIPDELHAAMPAPEEVDLNYAVDCIDFLMNDWLVDVETSPAGKAVIIAMTAQTIQRHLLAERPAYIIDAGQRGGGKTTTVIMSHVAVTGVRPAAAAWSDDPNERRKGLVSAFMVGRAMLPFDNISRGTLIRCPHIEASLTSPEMTDRVLNESRIVTVITTPTLVFTGNSIAGVGDMASRVLRVVLEISRPDPENRDFVHSDPIGWTLDHRGAILNALYSILLVPCTGPGSSTRFKLWDQIVGGPIESVFNEWAKRRREQGQDVPSFAFQDLLRSNEDEDTEAEGTREVLNALWDKFPNKGAGPLADPRCCFKAADFSKMLEYPPKLDPMTVDLTAYYDTRRKIDQLRASLGAAVGGTLQGGQIGAQEAGFRLKSLVGRAIDSGDRILTLRRKPVTDSKKKDSATYFIEQKAIR
ncbi:hypothetical protein E2E30_08880 [Sphingomonas sp. AAP5]|uniref:hypothetical protein n=1 Tax=Sphingomonas sp. AAP5 TaxID=1523415 RepID=UPI001056F5C5|nr:hypothetical protein [Sphingomonas sp. AAP5]QBM75876.1 hypothetical protein E2E30_08880 [Sphingomonas sp. AAP5]